MGTKKPRSLTTSGFLGVASIKDAQYGCGDGIYYHMQICFGLFAIRRSYTTNDAIFDPDFCGVLTLYKAIAIYYDFCML